MLYSFSFACHCSWLWDAAVHGGILLLHLIACVACTTNKYLHTSVCVNHIDGPQEGLVGGGGGGGCQLQHLTLGHTVG